MAERNYWIARMTDIQDGGDYYWNKAKEEQAWLTYLRYEGDPRRRRAVTRTLNIIKQVKANDVLFLTRNEGKGPSKIFAMGIVQKCPYDKIKGITIDNIKDQFPEETIVHYEGSDVFYQELKNGIGCWPQRIKVDRWEVLENKPTTSGLKYVKTNGSYRLSFFGVPREFVVSKGIPIKDE